MIPVFASRHGAAALGPGPARATVIPAVWVAMLGVFAATLMVATNAGLPGLAFNLSVAAGVGLNLFARGLTAGQMPAQMLVSALAGAAFLFWYLGRVVGQPMDEAVRIHVGNLLGNVAPGICLGLVAAWAVGTRRSISSADALVCWRRGLRTALWVNVMAVASIAGWLATRTGEGVLLVSTDLLAGAELYQVMGDALIVNLILALGLYLADLAGGETSGHTGHAVLALALAALACTVLLGSNKLLLVSVVVILAALLAQWRLYRRRRPLVAWLMLLSVPAAAAVLADAESVEVLLALTRVLDYGNVDSIWDTPSIASRLELLAECSSAQFGRSPWFGDLAAELMTCGPGEYVHSLISVQSHLGAVGTVLLLLALGRSAWVLSTCALYRAMSGVLALILVVALIGAFFTWMPFWFGLAWALALPVADPGSPAAAGRTAPVT